MTALSSHDVAKLLEVIREISAPCGLDEFPALVMAVVPRLVRSERTAYNEVNLQQGRIVGFMTPDDRNMSELAAQMQPYLHTHPLIAHSHGTGDSAPHTISEFWSRQTYLNSAIYSECFRALEVEDQLALPFGLAPGTLVAVTLNRSRRSFSDRDRTMLTLLGPHLAQAYAMALQTTRLEHEIALRGELWDAMDCGALLVRPGGGVAFCSAQAARWLELYCGADALRNLQVPALFLAWLEQEQVALPKTQLLRIERGAAVLEVRRAGVTAAGTLLLLEERVAPSPTFSRSEATPKVLDALQNLGLTARQSEVLLWLSRGESNAQIAARLGLSLHTIKHHLEAIFERLDVQSRSAASHRAQEALRFSPLD